MIGRRAVLLIYRGTVRVDNLYAITYSERWWQGRAPADVRHWRFGDENFSITVAVARKIEYYYDVHDARQAARAWREQIGSRYV